MRYFAALIALLVLLPPDLAVADDARQLHDFAHASGGYVADISSYGVWKAVTGDKTLALVLAVATTAAVAGAWELKGPSKPSTRDFGCGMLGAGFSTITILTFGF